MDYDDSDDYSEEIDRILNPHDTVFNHDSVLTKTWIPVDYRKDSEIKMIENKLEQEQNQVAALKRRIKELEVGLLLFLFFTW